MAFGAYFTERLVHAVGYELFAVLLFSPLMAWAIDRPLLTAGALSLVLSVIAMLWNMLYNALIDYFVALERMRWSWLVRIVHGAGFEAGLIVVCVPLTAWWLQITLLQALLVELGFFAFILPYTVLYNWCFDRIKHSYTHRPANRRNP